VIPEAYILQNNGSRLKIKVGVWDHLNMYLYVCMCIPHIIARQRFVKDIPVAMNTNATIEDLLEPVVFYAVRVISNESRIKLSGSKYVRD
jgi:hypothetical protein